MLTVRICQFPEQNKTSRGAIHKNNELILSTNRDIIKNTSQTQCHLSASFLNAFWFCLNQKASISLFARVHAKAESCFSKTVCTSKTYIVEDKNLITIAVPISPALFLA